MYAPWDSEPGTFFRLGRPEFSVPWGWGRLPVGTWWEGAGPGRGPLCQPGQIPLCPLLPGHPSWLLSFAGQCPRERAERDNPVVTGLIRLANYEE